MRSRFSALSLTTITIDAITASLAERFVPAFPRAEGFGASATGGRGGRNCCTPICRCPGTRARFGRPTHRAASDESYGRHHQFPQDVDGYLIYNAAPSLADADQDGMPDPWEKMRVLNPQVPNANGRDLDPDYDNIEVDINSLLGAVQFPPATK